MISRYKLKKYEFNLINVLNESTIDDINHGLYWYNDFFLWCEDLSKIYNKSTFIIASIFSALSPRNKLHKNKIDTITVLEAVKNNTPQDKIKVSTFNRNKDTAILIAQGKKTINKDSLKTYSFCQNIGYLNSNFVTIDVWQLRVLTGKKENKTPTKLEYLQLAELHKKIAKKINILPYQLQAITWSSLRNNYVN